MMNLFIVFAAIFTTMAIAADPIVQLPFGKIRGRQDVTFENNPIYIFEKIPYAAPPIGNLRFQPPQAHQGWDDILDTTHLDVLCIQFFRETNNETEDCLVLNIYTPRLFTGDNEALLPVMFYIHGGGFEAGSSDLYPGDRFVDKNVIFVSFNYRLGPFGFLSTGDDIIAGNFGLKDQQFALKWIFNNIHLFSGDPNKITLIGQSSGAASVGYQLLNQDNAGLIAGAILQSGSFLSSLAFQRNAREVAFATAALINTTFETNQNSQDLLDFLLSVDVVTLKLAAVEYRVTLNTESPRYMEITTGFDWAPVLEAKNPSAFLAKKMYKLLEAGNILPVPSIIGINSEEGLAFRDPDFMEDTVDQYDAHLDWLVPEDMAIVDLAEQQNMGTNIRNIYTNGTNMTGNLLAGIQFISDTSITRPTIKYAELFSKVAKTYFYQFSYHGVLSGQTNLFDGVAHSEEYPYFFCSGPNCNITWTDKTDQQISEWFMTLWTNFAKYQNPTPASSTTLQNITWTTVDTNFIYLNIGEKLEIIQENPKKDSYNKWIELYNSLNYNDFDTY